MIHEEQDFINFRRSLYKNENFLANIVKKNLIHLSIFSIFYNILLFSSPIYMLQLYNRIIPTRSEETLIWLTILVVILFIFMSSLDSVRSLVLIHVAKDFDHQFSHKVFERILICKDPSDAETWRSRKPLREVETITKFLSKGYLTHFFDCLWFPVFLIGLAFLHPLFVILAIIGATWLGLLAVGSHIILGRVDVERQVSCTPQNISTEEIAENAEIIISLGMVSNVLQRWKRGHENWFDEQHAISERLALVAAAGKMSRQLIQSLALGLGAYLAIHGSVSPGAIVASSVLIGRALSPIEGMIVAWNKLTEVNCSYRYLMHLLKPDRQEMTKIDAQFANGELRVDRLELVHSGKVIFRDLSFDARPGMMISIAGPSGSGKSALVKHLVGLKKGSEGSVRLSNNDVYTMDDKMRLDSIGYLPQAEAGIMGNVVDHIGRFGAFSAEDVLHAAQITNVNNMILNFPEGYATKLGCKGHYLSASQKQRLGLARACCGLRPLIVLDDPTSNLDEPGERFLLATIEELRRSGSIVCVVTNKNSLIRNSDLIVVLNTRGESRIGRPEQVLNLNFRAMPIDQKQIGSMK